MSYSVTQQYYTIHTNYIYIARLGIPGLRFEERTQKIDSVGKSVIKSMITLLLSWDRVGTKQYLFLVKLARNRVLRTDSTL